MTRIVHQITQRLLTSLVVAVLILSPITAFAQEAQPSDASSVDTKSTESSADTPESSNESEPAQASPEPSTPAPASPTPPTDAGPSKPNGAASTTYTLNPDTGLWENDHYTWDPATKQTKPKSEPTYSYNPATGMWDTTEWYYSPEEGTYKANVISTAYNPAPAALGGNAISNTGPGSNNTITSGGTTTGTFDLFFNASISNKIGQLSTSGNASVIGNTLGGNALSGDATALLNVLNMIQSTWGGFGSQDVAAFVANVDGDVVGDLYVDPSNIGGGGNTDVDINVTTAAAIDNDIDVTVASGDALVNSNTKAGNATSGNAYAVVNLLNLINSAIKANKSFIGVLNINGNLNGDILLPQEMMKAVIAATGPNSNNQIQSSGNTTANITVNDNKTIHNAIATTAGSGNATVANNTKAGSATTGSAQSNVVLLNFTGKKVVAKNAMLVFVNVMGSWVGLIFDAPVGTNAVVATGPNSNNVITDDRNLDLDVTVDATSLIDNDVTVSAHSGDAEVSNNTTGGDARTGDARVGVNILNMIDSELNVTDWFGVLFINVFGNWTGSFGVNTAAGNAPAAAKAGSGGSTHGVQTAAASDTDTFTFVPRNLGSTMRTTGETLAASDQQNASPTSAQSASGVSTAPIATNENPQTTNKVVSWWLAGLVTFIGATMLGGERIVAILRARFGA